MKITLVNTLFHLLKKKNESKGTIDKKEYVNFIENKVQLAKLIY